MRAFSPAATALESPEKNIAANSNTKSWCSSPFSNLVALSPEGNSLSFQLDFSPGASFTSPHIKFPHDHIHTSPHSANVTHGHRDHFTSLFSPSIFSPFNKTLKASKMDKSSTSSAIYSDFLDVNDPQSCSSKLISEDGEDSEENIFKSNVMPAYHSVDMQNINMNFGYYGPIGDHMQQSSHSSSGSSSNSNSAVTAGGLLTIDTDEENSNIVRSSAAGEVSLYDSTPRSQTRKGKRSSRGTSGGSGSKKAKATTDSNDSSGDDLSTGGKSSLDSSSASVSVTKSGNSVKSHGLFASPSAVQVRQPSNISPAGTDSTGGHCNCKKSKCLKLYCECFAALRYCNSCNCVECHNCPSHEKERQEAVIVTKERNSQAFQSKVNDTQGHTAGCNCKKSMCLKKYCECFEGAVFCGDNCKCLSCQNFSGSAKLEEMKRQTTDKKEKTPTAAAGAAVIVAAVTGVGTSGSGIVTSKDVLPGPLMLTVSHLPQSGGGHGNPSVSSSSVIHSTPLHGAPSTTLATPVLVNSPHKKRNRRCLEDCSDASSGSDGQARKSARECFARTGNFSPASLSNVSNSPGSDVSESQCSGSSGSGSGPEMSPSDKHLDMLDSSSCSSSDCSPELSFLHSSEKLAASLSTRGSCRPTQLLEPRYAFFGPQNHRATKLTALRCLEFLDNRDLYSVSMVNKLWSQAAMDDALWE